MKQPPVRDKAKHSAKQKARAEILSDLEAIKLLLESELAEAKEMLKRPEFNDSTETRGKKVEAFPTPNPAVAISVANKPASKAEKHHPTSLFAVNNNQPAHAIASKTAATKPSLKNSTAISMRSNAKQTVISSQKHSTEVKVAAQNGSNHSIAGIQLNDATVAKIVAEQQATLDTLQREAAKILAKNPRLVDQEQNLQDQANLLIQDIVDEFIPVIEAQLRKKLQNNADEFIRSLIAEHQQQQVTESY